tara:strand:- start:889 stop:1005 length:117 start_codon:yes stop_codon:yes gene_type:complete
MGRVERPPLRESGSDRRSWWERLVKRRKRGSVGREGNV